jgi:hypothetical protein
LNVLRDEKRNGERSSSTRRMGYNKYGNEDNNATAAVALTIVSLLSPDNSPECPIIFTQNI